MLLFASIVCIVILFFFFAYTVCVTERTWYSVRLYVYAIIIFSVVSIVRTCMIYNSIDQTRCALEYSEYTVAVFYGALFSHLRDSNMYVQLSLHASDLVHIRHLTPTLSNATIMYCTQNQLPVDFCSYVEQLQLAFFKCNSTGEKFALTRACSYDMSTRCQNVLCVNNTIKYCDAVDSRWQMVYVDGTIRNLSTYRCFATLYYKYLYYIFNRYEI
jgi:hypothetical protein